MSDEYPKPIDPPELVQRLARDVGGTLTECAALPDGSGFAMMSMPLPKGHWLTAEGFDDSPMPFRMGAEDSILVSIFPNEATELARTQRLSKRAFEAEIQKAARYACRASTMNGKETDFDPDAMTRNFINGMVGYNTVDGRSHLDDPPKAVHLDLEEAKLRLSQVCYGGRWTDVLRLTDEIERLRANVELLERAHTQVLDVHRQNQAAAHIAEALPDQPHGMGVKVAPRQPPSPVVDPVRPAAPTYIAAGRDELTIVCPRCDGDRGNAGGATCENCHGRGYVSVFNTARPASSTSTRPALRALLERARPYVAECIHLSDEVRAPNLLMKDTLAAIDAALKEPA